MARRSGRGGGGFRSALGGNKPRDARSGRSPVPAKRMTSPPPALSGEGGGFLSRMGGTIMSGIGHGIGFSIAGHAVDSVMGGRKVEVVHTQEDSSTFTDLPKELPFAAALPESQSMNGPRNPCYVYQRDLNQCVSTSTDVSSCQGYLEALKSCQHQQATFT